jgi:DNA-binding ferritin-like protein (Dps family)
MGYRMKTRDLIGKGKLRAIKLGDPKDYRAGYEITEKDLYDLVVTEIPIMREILDHLLNVKKTKLKASKASAKE